MLLSGDPSSAGTSVPTQAPAPSCIQSLSSHGHRTTHGWTAVPAGTHASSANPLRTLGRPRCPPGQPHGQVSMDHLGPGFSPDNAHECLEPRAQSPPLTLHFATTGSRLWSAYTAPCEGGSSTPAHGSSRHTRTRYRYLQVSLRKKLSIRSSLDLSITWCSVAYPHLQSRSGVSLA